MQKLKDSENLEMWDDNDVKEIEMMMLKKLKNKKNKTTHDGEGGQFIKIMEEEDEEEEEGGLTDVESLSLGSTLDSLEDEITETFTSLYTKRNPETNHSTVSF